MLCAYPAAARSPLPCGVTAATWCHSISSQPTPATPCWAATGRGAAAQAGGQQLLGQRPAADPLPQLQIRCENVIKIPRQGC
eukprot:COSAG01_NODE_4534_length_4945_cov_171.303756_8_plen_81_part_01